MWVCKLGHLRIVMSVAHSGLNSWGILLRCVRKKRSSQDSATILVPSLLPQDAKLIRMSMTFRIVSTVARGLAQPGPDQLCILGEGGARITQIVAESCEERFFRTHRTRCSIVSLSAPGLARSVFAIYRTLWSIVSIFETSQECPKGLQGRPTPIELTLGAPGLKDHGVGSLPESEILNRTSWVGRS